MRALRIALGVLGGALLAAGLLIAFTPGVAAVARLGELVALVGNDYLVVLPLAVLAAIALLGILAARARSGIDQATPPNPEGVPTAPYPGSEFDRLTAISGGLLSRLAGRGEAHVRDRLRETAVRTVMRTEQCSRRAANERVAEGDWTDDPKVAAFLAPEQSRDGGILPSLRRTLTSGRDARRAAAAIARYAETGADGNVRHADERRQRDGDAPADD